MFKKMRRWKQQLTNEETINILNQQSTRILGVLSDDGYPYTIPVNYVYKDNKIYIHGARSGHKIDAIKHCDKVSFCIIDKDELISEKLTTYYRSVIVFW